MKKIIENNLNRILSEGKEIQIITKDETISIFRNDVTPMEVASTLDVPEGSESSKDIEISTKYYSFEEINSKFEDYINLECDRSIVDSRIESLTENEIMYLKKYNDKYIYIIERSDI